MAEVNIKQLLEAGVHFGHQTQRWNPKMKKYIFGERNGIYIINLELTLSCLQKALDFLRTVSSQGKEVLLVGTKKQAQDILREAAGQCQMPYVDQRWLGGTLTNFETVRKSVARLNHIDQMEQDGSFQFMKKKEVLLLTREREKLLKNLKGIRHMKKLPGALFVIDSKKEEIAIQEAVKLKIPVAAVIDTNADPDLVDFPIPGNDDALRAIKLFCSMVSAAIQEGRGQFKKSHAEAELPQEAPVEEIQEETVQAAAPPVIEQVPAAEDVPIAPEPLPLPEDTKEEKLAEQFVPVVELEEGAKAKIKKQSRKAKL